MAVSEGVLLAGRYRVIGRLGSGGMGTVYLAEDERLGRRVAVKRLHAESPEDLALRFQREAELGASLNHPNVVAVYDAAPDDYGVLIVMEYVEGRTLADAIRAGDLSDAARRRVLAETAVALDHAHSVGVVHRDVKPANVLLRHDGVVKLTDLGIATAAEREQITRTGALLGTPSYMAPEQLEGEPTGPMADVYALAAVAFEVLCGRKAVIGRSPVEIAHRVVVEPPPDLRSAWPEAPEPAAAVLMRGMAKAPAERPESAGALVGELVEALGPEGPGALDTRPAPAAPVEEDRTYVEEEATGLDATRFKPGPSRSARRRPRAALAGWTAGIVLLLGAAAAIALSSSDPEPAAERPRSAPRAPAPPPAAPRRGPADARPDGRGLLPAHGAQESSRPPGSSPGPDGESSSRATRGTRTPSTPCATSRSSATRPRRRAGGRPPWPSAPSPSTRTGPTAARARSRSPGRAEPGSSPGAGCSARPGRRRAVD
ncbi:MAG: serine/threonine-protein kinase [Thermoleophilaceae bacterium]